MFASQNGHSDVVNLLLDKSAKVNMENSFGWSALMVASLNEHSDIANLPTGQRCSSEHCKMDTGLAALMAIVVVRLIEQK